MKCRFIVYGIISAVIFSSQALSAPLPREQWGAPKVKVSQADKKWIIAGKKQTVTLDRQNLSMKVQSGKVTWNMAPSDQNDMSVLSEDGQRINLRLADAGEIRITPHDTGYKTGIKIRLGKFSHEGRVLDLGLCLTVCLEGRDEDLICEVVAIEKETLIHQLSWPKVFNAGDVDYTVVPNVGGIIVPRNWPSKIGINSICYDRGSLYMPWWGYQQGASAMMVIMETADDARFQMSHPSGGPTSAGLTWEASLGKLAYPRSARICFVPEGNYVSLCKRYRRYVMENGVFVSLKEKIVRQPLVAELIGTPKTRTSVLFHFQPESGLGRDAREKNPELNHQMWTFDQRAEQLRKLKAKGIEELCLVLDGWNVRGYDNQHPDILPPCPEAGGWKAMKRFFVTCKELGYTCVLHDQYWDYYWDALSFDEQFTTNDKSGTFSHWAGGKQSWLNARLAPGHLRKNHQWLLDHEIKLQGSNLDCFGAVDADEVHSEELPITRTECYNFRAKCFNWVRINEGIVGTEEAADWLIPYVDTFYREIIELFGGVPVPLTALVYHDAAVVPWTFDLNAGDKLQGLLRAGVPYLASGRDFMGHPAVPANTEDDSFPNKELMSWTRQMCGLHKRVGMLEMTNHEFLDENFKKERTTFSDGTTVTVDWNKSTVEIKPELTL